MGSERKGKLKQTPSHRIKDETQGTRSQEQQEQCGSTLSLLGKSSPQASKGYLLTLGSGIP